MKPSSRNLAPGPEAICFLSQDVRNRTCRGRPRALLPVHFSFNGDAPGFSTGG